MMDLLFEHMPENPTKLRRAVPWHLNHTCEIIYGEGGKVIQGFFMDAFHLLPDRVERGQVWAILSGPF